MHRPPARHAELCANGTTCPQKNTFRLKLTLKAPQNATDVITIVTFQTPVRVRPGRLAAPVEEALDGPHPRRDPALVRAGGLPGEGCRLLLSGEGRLHPGGQADLSDLHGPDRVPRVCAGQRRAVWDLGRPVRARAAPSQALRLLSSSDFPGAIPIASDLRDLRVALELPGGDVLGFPDARGGAVNPTGLSIHPRLPPAGEASRGRLCQRVSPGSSRSSSTTTGGRSFATPSAAWPPRPARSTTSWSSTPAPPTAAPTGPARAWAATPSWPSGGSSAGR